MRLVFVSLYVSFTPPHLFPEKKVSYYKGFYFGLHAHYTETLYTYVSYIFIVDMFSYLLRGVYILMPYRVSFTLNFTGEYSPA